MCEIRMKCRLQVKEKIEDMCAQHTHSERTPPAMQTPSGRKVHGRKEKKKKITHAQRSFARTPFAPISISIYIFLPHLIGLECDVWEKSCEISP